MEENNKERTDRGDEFHWLIGGISLIVMGIILILFIYILFDLFLFIAGVFFIISGIVSLYKRKATFFGQ